LLERWEHIVDPINHPEMEAYEEHLQITLQHGRRQQEPLNPHKYRYIWAFDDLPDDVNHIVVIVLCSFDVDVHGATIPNNYVATAFFKHIREKR
jgi:hypothetical protein